MVFPGLRSIFREGREDERRRWGVTRGSVSQANVFSLPPLPSLPTSPLPCACCFSYSAPKSPSLSTSVSYFSSLPLQYGVCGLPCLEVSRTRGWEIMYFSQAHASHQKDRPFYNYSGLPECFAMSEVTFW